MVPSGGWREACNSASRSAAVRSSASLTLVDPAGVASTAEINITGPLLDASASTVYSAVVLSRCIAARVC